MTDSPAVTIFGDASRLSWQLPFCCADSRGISCADCEPAVDSSGCEPGVAGADCEPGVAVDSATVGWPCFAPAGAGLAASIAAARIAQLARLKGDG
jgi:hypothetical protein